jgi:hypothetical protein
MNPLHDQIYSRTVMVVNLPKVVKSDVDLGLFFVSMFGENRVVTAHLVPDVTELSGTLQQKLSTECACVAALQKSRMHKHKQWKRAIYLMHTSKTKKRPRHRVGALSWIPSLSSAEVDSIDFYERQLDILDKEILAKQHSTLHTCRTGFVTFDTVSTAMQCSQVTT